MPGSDCEDVNVVPLEIPAQLPYTFSGLSTCGFGNEYMETCLDYYGSGEDMIFKLDLNVETCTP